MLEKNHCFRTSEKLLRAPPVKTAGENPVLSRAKNIACIAREKWPEKNHYFHKRKTMRTPPPKMLGKIHYPHGRKTLRKSPPKNAGEKPLPSRAKKIAQIAREKCRTKPRFLRA